jgi:hypothetical protein
MTQGNMYIAATAFDDKPEGAQLPAQFLEETREDSVVVVQVNGGNVNSN